jgi:hypothetical protein
MSSKNVGSVSHATMRPEDLIPCFLDELKRQEDLSEGDKALIAEIKHRMETNTEPCADGKPGLRLRKANGKFATYYESTAVDYDLEALFDALESYSPPFMYFGAHPNDGADYGWWLSEEWKEQLVEEGGIKVVDTSKIPPDFKGGYVAEVNDHGNVTLWQCSPAAGGFLLEEVWSIV